MKASIRFALATTFSAAVLFSFHAFAQNTSTTTTTTTAAPAATTSGQFKIPTPTYGDYSLRAGIKSTGTSGRMAQLDLPKGERFKQKHEYYLGAQHASGWGGYVQAVTSGKTFGDENLDRLSAGDPSVTLLHPDFYKGSDLRISGQARRYFPASDRSKDRNQQLYSYYLNVNYTMPARWSLFNSTIPRYFGQSYYKTGDTAYLLEDVTILSQKVNDWISYGIAQWTQIEWHEQAATGTYVEFSSFVKFTPMANLSIEPRLILPGHVRNTVNDAPANVSLRGARAELYAQMTL